MNGCLNLMPRKTRRFINPVIIKVNQFGKTPYSQALFQIDHSFI